MQLVFHRLAIRVAQRRRGGRDLHRLHYDGAITRGIDVGAKEEIYKLMDQLAGRGVAILFASSELEEIISLSDRALVMHEGRISGELRRSELSDENVMRLATGDDERLPERICA